MFNYGSFKLFLLKFFIGILFISLSSFLLLSFISFSSDDPGLGRLNVNVAIENYFGFFGAIASSFMMVVLGASSVTIPLYMFYVGVFCILGKKIRLIFTKFLLIILTVIMFDFSISIQEIAIFQTGLLSGILLDIFYFYFPFLENNFLYRFIVSVFGFSITFFSIIFAFSLNFIFLKNFLSKIFYFFFKSVFRSLKLFRLPKISRRNNIFKNNIIKNEPTISKNNKRNSRTAVERSTKNSVGETKDDFIFNLPSEQYLIKSKTKNSLLKDIENQNKANSEKLEAILADYGVDGKVIGFKTGPIVTLYEFVPNAGIKASKIIGLSDDIARAMSSVSARIASQPGKTSLGIEIPNNKRENVFFGDLIQKDKFQNLNNSLTLALGKDISGHPVFADLEKMPHLLIAGTTGSGKSVGINTIIMSILYRFKPNECKLILIDPKMLELSIYENIPHLLTPVVTNPNKAVFALKWVVREMENRYKLMSSLNVKNINSYNEKSRKIQSTGKKYYRQVQTGIDNETKLPILEKREISLEQMPFIVVVIDEMADLMMVAGKEVENLVQRLAQMARASGIHLVTATQRPSVDVITGTIKANFPSRLSYKVASKFDSRTILNEMGAEQLLGSGDMLFLENGASLKRLHGGYISETEIENVVNYIKEQAIFDEKNEITIDEKSDDGSLAFSFEGGDVDSLYSKAVNIVVEQQKVSTSYIQRYLQIGYNRAARIIEKMEEDGIISEANNAGKRQVLKKH